MKVEHKIDQQFYVENAEGHATLDYVREGDCINILRVFVPPVFRGQGLAKELTVEAFEYAKSKKYQVIPSCPYVSQTFLARYPQYQELCKK